ncbi:MAG: hypothetical protein WBW32_11750 [Luteibacter sp.]
MNIIRKLFSAKPAIDEAPTAMKKRRKLAKRSKQPRGAVRLDNNAPILEQLRSCR